MLCVKQINKEKHTVKVHFLSCGIFQLELEQVLQQIRDENLFDCEFMITYLKAGLHSNFDNLKNTILRSLEAIEDNRIILLYGSKCHLEFDEFLKDYSLIRFPQPNCIKLILGESMEKIEQDSNTFYLTPGWLLKWREIFDSGWGLDKFSIRQSFGYCDRVLFKNTNVCEITDEQILEFFEYTGVYIEIENVELKIFKNNIITAIKQAIKCE